jgi:hypothetical protein
MSAIFVLLTLFLGNGVFAAVPASLFPEPSLPTTKAKPVYLPDMNLPLTMSSAHRTKVHFIPGSIYACTHTPGLMPGFIKDYFKCTLAKSGASVVFPGDDHARNFWFKFLRAQYQFYNRRLIRRYDFEGIEVATKAGEPLSTNVSMEVWYYDDAPGKYFGFLKLADQGIHGSFGYSALHPGTP